MEIILKGFGMNEINLWNVIYSTAIKVGLLNVVQIIFSTKVNQNNII